MGHALGLYIDGEMDTNYSNKNKASCMDYTAKPEGGGKYGRANLRPGTKDYLALWCAYVNGYKHTSCTGARRRRDLRRNLVSSSSSSTELDVDDAAVHDPELGELVEHIRHESGGYHKTYVKNKEDGGYIVVKESGWI